jgi:hypothetical protein
MPASFELVQENGRSRLISYQLGPWRPAPDPRRRREIRSVASRRRRRPVAPPRCTSL